MKKIILSCLVLCLLVSSPSKNVIAEGWLETGFNIFNSINSSSGGAVGQVTSTEIAEAFKEALAIGTEHVVRQLGSFDGFNGDPNIHIPLPRELESVKTILSTIGLSYMVDDLELKLNRAAEAATPKAKELFLQSIRQMTFEDVMGIYNGPKDSATRYFQSKMTQPLKQSMHPIVDSAMAEVGAVSTYDSMIGQYKDIPFVPDVKADLTDYVLEQGIEGIFYYIAQEEEAIRSDPLKQTTSLLKKVFGSK